MFPKIGDPQIIRFNEFSIINRPFWGSPIFGNTHTNLLRFFSPWKSQVEFEEFSHFWQKKTSMICCDSLGFSDMKGGKSWDITWKPS